MSACKRKVPFAPSASSLQLPLGREVNISSSPSKQSALTPSASTSASRGRAQVKVVCATGGAAIWSFLIVLWICHSMPETSYTEATTYIQGRETKPFFVLLLIGVLMLGILLVYGVVRPHKRGIRKPDTSEDDIEKGLSNKGGKVAASPCSVFDSDSDDFVSCDELSDDNDSNDDDGAVPPGTCLLAGLLVDVRKLPNDAGSCDYQTLVQDICRQCSLVHEISLEQSLRLAVGLNFDAATIVDKWREVCAWRDKHKMDEERERCLQSQAHSTTEVVSFPHQDEIYSKAFVVSPCALISCKGEPVSIWHVGTGSSSATMVPVENIEEWARSVFEYADVWVQTQSQATSRFLGHIQVFDMGGVGLRQLANSALHERFKRALGSGANYVELISHIYVINSSWAFSKVWNIVKPMISPRTSSKVTVATDVPKELLSILSSDSAKMLPEILRASGGAALPKVQRPPRWQ